MIKLNFEINKEYLAAHALKAAWWNKSPFPEWKKIAFKMQKKYPDAELFFYGDSALAVKKFDIYQKFENLIKEIITSKDFQKIYNETEDYLKFIKNQWDKNKKEALQTIEELLNFKIPDKNITVFITHPKLKNGATLRKYNTILWGHPEDFENYSTVYLCHELLHLIIPGNIQNDYELEMHALIEMITDDELRMRLNKKGRYFEVPTHKELLKIRKKIYPEWKRYLKEKRGMNIIDLVKKLKSGD